MKDIKKRVRREQRMLLCMSEYSMGGAETQFRYFIEYAEKNKWKLDVLIEHRYCEPDVSLHENMLQFRNVRFYQLHGYGNDEARIGREVIRHIIRECYRVKYSACLIYTSADLPLAPTLKILGIRVVYSERVDASTIMNNFSFTRLLKYCNRILANSEYAQNRLEKLTGRRVGLIRNGKPVVQQLPMKENREIRRILFPGRIVAHKNQIFMLYYLRDYPDFTGKIVFAGMVEDRVYQQKLVSFINRNHLQERVEFLGYVEDMRTEYEKADLVILPSQQEGTPNIVLEAYAYGRPVIVSDIETERDVVKNPKLRFGLKDTGEIDRCIKYIQNISDEEYRIMLDNNRKFVLKNYNIERMAKKIYRVLNQKSDNGKGVTGT